MLLNKRRFGEMVDAFGVEFPERSTLDHPEIRKILSALSPSPDVIQAMREEIQRAQEEGKLVPKMAGASARDAAAGAVFSIMPKTPVVGAPVFDRRVFEDLVAAIRAETSSYTSLTNAFISPRRMDLVFFYFPSVIARKRFGDVPTFAMTANCEMLVNTEFAQQLINYAYLAGIKPSAKLRKYESNGGDFPDAYVYIEFVARHELDHFVYGDHVYNKILRQKMEEYPDLAEKVKRVARPEVVINYVGDFLINYRLMELGLPKLPIGLFSPDINFRKQRTYREVLHTVLDELLKLTPDQQQQVIQDMADNVDTHPVPQDEDMPPSGDMPSPYQPPEGEPPPDDVEPGGQGSGQGQQDQQGSDQQGQGQSGQDQQGSDQQGQGQSGQGQQGSDQQGQSGQDQQGSDQQGQSGQDQSGQDRSGQTDQRGTSSGAAADVGQRRDPLDDPLDGMRRQTERDAESIEQNGVRGREEAAAARARELQRVSDRAAKLAQAARNAANAALSQFDYDPYSRPVNWKALLKRLVSTLVKREREETYLRVNPYRVGVQAVTLRSAGQALVPPGEKWRDVLGHSLMIVIDDSGSMSDVTPVVLQSLNKLYKAIGKDILPRAFVVKFSSGTRYYLADLRKKKAWKIPGDVTAKLREAQMRVDKFPVGKLRPVSWDELARSGQFAGTTLDDDLTRFILRGLKSKRLNVLLLTDTDALWSGNQENLAAIVHAAKPGQLAVMTTMGSYRRLAEFVGRRALVAPVTE